MQCPNPKCKGDRRLETKKTFDELDRIRRVKQCPKCGHRLETIELYQAAYDREQADAKKYAEDLAGIIGQREDALLEVREAVQILLRQVPPAPAAKKGRKA